MSTRIKLGVERLDKYDTPQVLMQQPVPGQDLPQGKDWHYTCPSGFELVEHHQIAQTATCVQTSKSVVTYDCPEDWTLAFRHDHWACVRDITIAAELICPEGYLKYFRSCIRTEHMPPDGMTCTPPYQIQFGEGSKPYASSCVKTVFAQTVGLRCFEDTETLVFFKDPLDQFHPSGICFDFEQWFESFNGPSNSNSTPEEGHGFIDMKKESLKLNLYDIPGLCNGEVLQDHFESRRPYSGILSSLMVPKCRTSKPKEDHDLTSEDRINEALNYSRPPYTFSSIEQKQLWMKIEAQCDFGVECNATGDLHLPAQTCPPGYFDALNFEALLEFRDPHQENSTQGAAHLNPVQCTGLAVIEPQPSCRSGWTANEDGKLCTRTMSSEVRTLCPAGFKPVGATWPKWSKYITGTHDTTPKKDRAKQPMCHGEMTSPAMPVCEPGFRVSSDGVHCTKELITPPSVMQMTDNPLSTHLMVPCHWSNPGVLNCVPDGIEDRATIHSKGYATHYGFQD